MEDPSGIYHDGGLERNYRDGPKLNAYRVHTSLAQRAELNYTWAYVLLLPFAYSHLCTIVLLVRICAL